MVIFHCYVSSPEGIHIIYIINVLYIYTVYIYIHCIYICTNMHILPLVQKQTASPKLRTLLETCLHEGIEMGRLGCKQVGVN